MDREQTTDPAPTGDLLTMEAGVQEFTQLAELSDALAGRFAVWSTDGADPASSGMMASLAARLAEHASWWRDRIPESVLLEDARTRVAGSPRMADVLSLLEVVPADRVAAAVPILDGLVAHLVGLAERLSPLGDAPARRIVRLALADLEDRPC